LGGIDYPSQEPFEALSRWQREGELVRREDMAVGLQNVREFSWGLFENFARQLVKIAGAAA
jgi:NADPH-dependent curcumin reductase CurA